MKITDIQLGRRFNRVFFALVISVLFIVVATNTVIDPKNQLGLLRIDKLNSIKYFATGGRYEKSARLTYGDFNALIAGSSRTQIGIDPSQPALSGYRTYNAALSGTNMTELSGVLGYALQHQNIEQLIVGLDFLLFTRNKKLSPDYQNSLFTGSYTWLAPYLLSTSTFKRSIKTIKLNQQGSSRIHSNDNGFIDKTGSEIDHRLRFQEVLSRNFLIDPEYYGAYNYSNENIVLLEQALSLYQEKGIKTLLFISPIHARQLEAIRAMGLWDIYQQWKRDLVFLARRLEQKHASTIPLWDFSGYNTITMETIPPSESEENMRWYWESSHYKKSVGNFILDKMAGRRNIDIPADFGVLLQHGNIQMEINLSEINRAFYAMNYPQEVNEVIKLVDNTRPARTLKAKQAGVTALQPTR